MENVSTKETISARLSDPWNDFPNGATKQLEEGMDIFEALFFAARHGDRIAVQTSALMFAQKEINNSGILPTRQEIFDWANNLGIDPRHITQNWREIETYMSAIRPRREVTCTEGVLSR